MTITHGADEEHMEADDVVDLRLQSVEKELRVIREQLDDIKEVLVKADGTISKVADEVKPTLDALLKSPLIKMLMPKGK